MQCVRTGLFVSPRGHIQGGSRSPGISSPSRSLKLLQFGEHSPTKSYSSKTCVNKKLSGSQELNDLCSWDQRPWSAAVKKKKKNFFAAELNFQSCLFPCVSLAVWFGVCCTLAAFLQCLPPYLEFLWFVFPCWCVV